MVSVELSLLYFCFWAGGVIKGVWQDSMIWIAVSRLNFLNTGVQEIYLRLHSCRIWYKVKFTRGTNLRKRAFRNDEWKIVLFWSHSSYGGSILHGRSVGNNHESYICNTLRLGVVWKDNPPQIGLIKKKQKTIYTRGHKFFDFSCLSRDHFDGGLCNFFNTLITSIVL